MFDIADYQETSTVAQALEMLAADPQAILIAGGTDVLIKLRHNQLPEARLVGIRHIDALRTIELTEDGYVMIGAAVTFSQLMSDDIIRRHVPVLAVAAADVGGPQIRRVATIGGNICNGATSADSAPSLFAFNAMLRLESPKGVRLTAISEFYRGPGKVNLAPGEILTAIMIAPCDYQGMGAHYIKYAMRKAMDIATLGCAAACRLGTDGKLTDVRLAFGVAAPTPVRCPQAEAVATGSVFSEELAAEFAEAATAEISPRTSWRASKEFRLHLARHLSAEALTKAYVQAGGKLS